MKNLLSLFVIIALFSITGCREEIATGPDPASAGKLVTYEEIEICCQVQDPATGDCGLLGSVYYQHQIISDPRDETAVYTVLLNIEMNADLCSLCMMVHPEWRIKEVSEETVTISEEGVVLLEKYYPISNREDIILCVQYLVSTSGMGIPAIWLQEVD